MAARSSSAPPGSTVTDRRGISASPAPLDPGTTASDATPRAPEAKPALRLDVRAPAVVRVGDVVIISIDVEAFGGIQNLSFVVIYDGLVLDYNLSSPGSFVQQASAPVTLIAEDPACCNIFVNMTVKNGGVVAAAGTVVNLEFRARSAGTSPITLREVSYLERGRATSSTAAIVGSASVTVE